MCKLLIQLMDNNYKKFFIFLIFISATSLAFAYYVEHVLGFVPCPLCIYQRVPYYILIILAMLGLLYPDFNRVLYKIIMLNFLLACILAGYHTAIELGILEASKTCKVGVSIPDGLPIEKIKELLYSTPVTGQCDIPSFKIFNIPMSVMNFCWNLLLLFYCVVNLYYYKCAKTSISSK